MYTRNKEEYFLSMMQTSRATSMGSYKYAGSYIRPL